MSEPTMRDVRDQLQYAIAQLRHAYQQLFSHDKRWSRRGMQQFADGLIAPQIRKLEQVDHLLAALAAPPDSKAPICLECQQQIDAAGYCLTCSATREWALTHQGAAPLDSKENRMEFVDIVFDGPPSHESGRFVEAEGPDGRSIRIGQWIVRGDGYWALRVPLSTPPDPNSVLLSVPRDEVEAVTAFLTQRAAGGAEGQEQPRLDLWLCGCGAWNAVTLTNCGLCNRLRVKSGATRQYWQAAPVPQGERAPERE